VIDAWILADVIVGLTRLPTIVIAEKLSDTM
jgi:hypothetical protein